MKWLVEKILLGLLDLYYVNSNIAKNSEIAEHLNLEVEGCVGNVEVRPGNVEGWLF